MTHILFALLVIRVLAWLIPVVVSRLHIFVSRLKIIPGTREVLFDHNYIEIKNFYVREFQTTPCISFINNLDVEKAFAYLAEGHAGRVLGLYQRNYFNWQKSKLEFTYSVFKLEKKIMIELGDDYAEILFDKNSYEFVNSLVEIFSTYKAPAKEDEHEINIITHNSNGLDLKQLEITPTTLDIDLYYNDDFKPIDEVIKTRLEKESDKGIILLHGLPGTGKTTYLRHVIGSIKKKVLFVSPAVAGNLMNPEFIDLLIDNPNAVVVIEDAENIIMDRKYSPNSSVSNLLNISDGLLSDCLNVQIICTFNSDIHLVDSALMRKGRLIARYEFGKLGIEKAKRLSAHFGFDTTIDKPMTIAEIANPHEKTQEVPNIEVVGFRRREVVMN